MLKTRIIPVMLCKGRELVKGKHFVNERRVGNAMQAARVHDARNVDELVLLEVGGGLIDADTVNALASECFMPLTVGGGIRTLEDIHWLLGAGADKVVLGHFGLVADASKKFGAQAVVCSLAMTSDDDAVEWAKYCQHLGAGEILLQSVERDGTMQGYDLEAISAVSAAVSIPVIASSGCGTYQHMEEALRAGAHAVAAGAMFQFTDQTPQGAAHYLHARGYQTRVAA
jgi:cyclase